MRIHYDQKKQETRERRKWLWKESLQHTKARNATRRILAQRKTRQKFIHLAQDVLQRRLLREDLHEQERIEREEELNAEKKEKEKKRKAAWKEKMKISAVQHWTSGKGLPGYNSRSLEPRTRYRGQPGTFRFSKLLALQQYRSLSRQRPRVSAEEQEKEDAEISKPERKFYPETFHIKGGAYVTLQPTVLQKAQELVENPNLEEVINAPRKVLDMAAKFPVTSKVPETVNFVVDGDQQEKMDEEMLDLMELKRDIVKTPKFVPNVYSCVLGQYSYDDPPSEWVPYPADDFFSSLDAKSGRVRDEEGDLTKAFETPPIPQPSAACDEALPQTALLEQLHRYASGYAHRNYPLLMNKLDESALLGMGVVVEEKIKEMLGKNGDLFYAVKEGTEKGEERDKEEVVVKVEE
ncbi:hypothetical protein CJU90_6142 [Yarrowia sp. C11]|nr:hypothetical protein CJU90_6142 [Yarrowia sp. C11]KAG5370850.1 hypothetical protein CKK34_0982 [Yarrowia sp. E02]